MMLKMPYFFLTRQLVVMILLIVLLLVSCDNKPRIKESLIAEGSTTVIKPKLDYSQLDISAILDTVKFVKLELTDKSFIGNINKVIVFEDRIYVLDKQTSSLFVFNMDGKFIFKISRIGRGPEEYIQLDFFDIDLENKQIVLTDLMGYWMLRYDLEGNYVSRKKIPFWIEGVVPIFNNGAVVYSNHRNNNSKLGQEYNIFYLDSLMQISKAYFPYKSSNFDNPQIKFITPQSGSFYTYNKSRYFFSAYKDQVYQITEEGLNPKYLFDFEGKAFNEEYLSQKNELKRYKEKGEFYSLVGVLENDDYVIFSFYLTSNPIGHFGYYSKKSGRVICSAGFTIGENNYFEGNTIATYDSWIIATVQPERLLSWGKGIDKNKIPLESEYAKLIKNVADGITLEDNEVLMFYKLKKF